MKKVEINLVKELLAIKNHEEEVEGQLHDLRKNKYSTQEEYLLKLEQYKDICNRRQEFIKNNKLPNYLNSIKAKSLSLKIENSKRNSNDEIVIL